MNEWHDYGEYIYPLSCVRVMHFPSAFHYYVTFFCSPILHAGETALHTNPACDPLLLQAGSRQHSSGKTWHSQSRTPSHMMSCDVT